MCKPLKVIHTVYKENKTKKKHGIYLKMGMHKLTFVLVENYKSFGLLFFEQHFYVLQLNNFEHFMKKYETEKINK